MQKGTLFADFFTGSQKTAPSGITPSVTASPCQPSALYSLVSATGSSEYNVPQGGRSISLNTALSCLNRIFREATTYKHRLDMSHYRRLIRRRNAYSASVCFLAKQTLMDRGIGSLCRRLVQRRNAYSASVCFLAKQTSLFEGGGSEADGRSSPLRGRYRFAMPPLSSASECVFRIRLFPIKTDLPLRGRCQRS